MLRIDRLDHGNRSLEDEALTARLVRDKMTLTVCPLSNIKLCVVDSAASHPIAQMLRLGLRATINSDDPAYFGGYVNDNYRAVAGNLSREDLTTLARNSFSGVVSGAQPRSPVTWRPWTLTSPASEAREGHRRPGPGFVRPRDAGPALEIRGERGICCASLRMPTLVTSRKPIVAKKCGPRKQFSGVLASASPLARAVKFGARFPTRMVVCRFRPFRRRKLRCCPQPPSRV